MLRTLHVAAVMQPWWVWIENVRAITTVKEGRVWALIKTVAEMTGFVVQLDHD
jgi:site-specific DNA-cytosine methylase